MSKITADLAAGYVAAMVESYRTSGLPLDELAGAMLVAAVRLLEECFSEAEVSRQLLDMGLYRDPAASAAGDHPPQKGTTR